MPRTLLGKVSLAILAALLLCGTAAAQSFPQKPIRIICPFPPGGIADVFSRAIAQKMTEDWGQPVVVENRTGAGGNIGAELVAKAPPDGYTLVMGNIGTHALNTHLFKSLPFDPIKDFAPVALVLEADGLLVVNPSVQASSVKELIDLARANPGKLSYGSAGMGTTSHLAGELFKSLAKVDVTHVPYKGNVPAITDLLSGQLTMVFATMPTVLPHVKAGKLRSLAVTGPVRNPAVPDTPTVAETLVGFEVNNWIGLFAPAGTPPEIVRAINAEITKAMSTPEIKARLATEGARFTPNTPEQFAAFVRKEVTEWGKVIKAANITAE